MKNTEGGVSYQQSAMSFQLADGSWLIADSYSVRNDLTGFATAAFTA
jgi:hypothetical protein